MTKNKYEVSPQMLIDLHLLTNYLWSPATWQIISKTSHQFYMARFLFFSGQDFYSLRDIIFFFENAELSTSDYRKKAFDSHINKAVVEQDRHDLRNYLTGVISDCNQIDKAMAAASAAALEARAVMSSNDAIIVSDGSVDIGQGRVVTNQNIIPSNNM